MILGQADLSLSETDPSDKLHKRLKFIHQAAASAKGVTRQLLAYARKQTIAPKLLNLNDSIDGMIKMLCRLIGEEVELVLKSDPDLWTINFDTTQLDQILVNLCINAKDAFAGIGKIVIETKNMTLDNPISTDQEEFLSGEYVLLSVGDDGCGMDNATMVKIFEPFFTTKPMYQGTGLGLSTVYGIIKQNNGFINIDSELGKGTTFEIYIPRHMGEADEIKAGDTTKELQ